MSAVLAYLRAQVPKDAPLDGLLDCGEDDTMPTFVVRDWAKGHDTIATEVFGDMFTHDPTRSRVTIKRGQDPTDDGCGDQVIDKDGMFIVGKDIQPGTYQTDGGANCYWARLSGFGGTFDDIIANNAGAGSQTVTIAASDKAFKTERCGLWQKKTD
jgi:hypothetical protein